MSIIEILQQIFNATEEQSTAFSEAMKTNGIYTTTHENMDVRYPKLKGEYDSLNSQYGEANKLIEDMKKSTKGQEALQGKITAYEEQLKQAQAENEQIRLDAAIKVGLLSEKAVDVGYLTYLLKEKAAKDGEPLTLDDAGEVKGWKDKLESLKTEKPNMFESTDGNSDGYAVYKPNSLRKADGTPGDKAMTKEQFDKLGYSGKVQLRQENPELYNQMTKG